MTMTSEELFKEALKLMPGGVNSPVRAFGSVGGQPFFTTSAQGARLTTAEGKELIDYVGTWGPAIHGHNHPVIRDAIAEALSHGTSFGTPNPYEVKMGQEVIRRFPSIEKIRMVNSGTEATMSCIRLARGYTGRNKIIKFAGCYHGHVDSLLVKAGSGALTFGNPDSAGIPDGFARETIVLPFNDVEALEETFTQFGETVAGVILEAYPANVGLIFPQPGYLQKLRNLCNENGTVLIFDEVMTGFRVSSGGVQEKEGVYPDLTALGKIIGGGLPVGAFGGRAEIMGCLAPEGPVYQAGTLSGNPLAMAAGIASLSMLTDAVYKHLNDMGTAIRDGLLETAEQIGLSLQVPQTGSMFSIYFSAKPVTNYEEAIASDSAKFKRVFHYALNNGVYLPPSAYETCFISNAHDDEAIAQTIEVLTGALKAL